MLKQRDKNTITLLHTTSAMYFTVLNHNITIVNQTVS